MIFLRILAFVGFVILSPIITISCLLILLEDGFPLLFIQKRIGKYEEVFKIFKIRTMHTSTPSLGTHEISSKHYLKIGNILRNLKIDELPQIINFVVGDINLVGPRPGLENQIELLHHRRLNKVFTVKPGITGLSQVLGYDMSNPELLSKIDNLYIEKQSAFLDIEIFFATFFRRIRNNLKNKFEKDIIKLI